MRTLMKIVVIAALLTVVSLPARADAACAAGSVCTVTLTQTNTIQLNGIVITVTIDNTGTNTVLSFQLTTNPLSLTPLGIDQLGWNGIVVGTGKNANSAAVSSSSTGWNGSQPALANGSLDGFGQFNVQGSDPAGSGGITTAITFTLNGLITNFPENNSGNEFAVHIRYSSPTSCSGWVGGDTGSSSPNSEPGCSTSQVPEPASLALFGTGLVGIAGVIRRRMRR